MADTLRVGDTGQQVETLQKILNKATAHLKPLKVDGDFGPKTEDRVDDFQKNQHLLTDGVVGPVTWKALVAKTAEWNTATIVVSGFDKWGRGYDRSRHRKRTSDKLQAIRGYLNALGGVLTSSGGLRSLNANVSASRSATSFHYSGRAHDLFVYSGMVDPETDPYVCVQDEDEPRRFTVWARVTDCSVDEQELAGFTYGLEEIKVTGRFVNLTAMMLAQGLYPIRARSGFLRGKGDMRAEWWHFQDVEDLTPEESFFGHEIAAIHRENTVRGSAPWKFRDRLYMVDWF